MDRDPHAPRMGAPQPAAPVASPGAEQDLLLLERWPIDLAGRYPGLRPQGPRPDARGGPRAVPKDLLLVGPGGLVRLSRGRR